MWQGLDKGLQGQGLAPRAVRPHVPLACNSAARHRANISTEVKQGRQGRAGAPLLILLIHFELLLLLLYQHYQSSCYPARHLLCIQDQKSALDRWSSTTCVHAD
jgi:hypothetical protein